MSNRLFILVQVFTQKQSTKLISFFGNGDLLNNALPIQEEHNVEDLAKVDICVMTHAEKRTQVTQNSNRPLA